MFKKFEVKAYQVYDLTEGRTVTEFPLQTIEAAERFIKEEEAFRRTRHQNYNSARPFEPHIYMIDEQIGTAEWELSGDDGYEPSFYELREVADEWRSGEYCKKYQFDD